jgi:hypothetical protein
MERPGGHRAAQHSVLLEAVAPPPGTTPIVLLLGRWATLTMRIPTIVGPNLHDLRRKAGSRLLEIVIPGALRAGRFLDQANPSTTFRYVMTTRREDAQQRTRSVEGVARPLHYTAILR